MGRQPRVDEPVFNRIAEVREAAGISRKDLATEVGVHYQTIGYLERGEYAPSLYLALRLAGLFGCRVEDLFALEDMAAEVASTSSSSE